jgi:hypothetical protein
MISAHEARGSAGDRMCSCARGLGRPATLRRGRVFHVWL